MATYADSDGSNVYPGMTRLAEGTGLSERAVRGAVGSLLAENWIGLVARANPGAGLASRYRLTMPTAARGAGVAPAGDAGIASPAPAAGTADRRQMTTPTPAAGASHPVTTHSLPSEGRDGGLHDLDPEELARIAPPFDDDPPPEPERITDGLDPRRVAAMKRSHDREGRDQGFDPDTGESISAESPRSRYRRRG